MYIFRETPQNFWELLVHVNPMKTHMSLYKQIPDKYSERILKQCNSVYSIQSVPHLKSTRTNLELLQLGIWICEGDCEAFGGVPPTLFGIPLGPEISRAFEMHKSILQSWSSSEWKRARVSYHGTSYENYLGICTLGLKSSFGMLGTGVYLGSFWKACRFAARDQEYKFREKPSVLRVVWTCKDEDVLHFPRQIMYCFCAECYLRPEQRSFCGHTMDWTPTAKVFPEKMPKDRKGGPRYFAGFLKPCKFPDSNKFVTQNEEWVINSSCILRLAECVTLNLDSVAKPSYDPQQRDIKIL
jgi:hypothetical protein